MHSKDPGGEGGEGPGDEAGGGRKDPGDEVGGRIPEG